MAADHRFIERLRAGEIEPAIEGFGDYSRFVGAEMGGRPLATFLGVPTMEIIFTGGCTAAINLVAFSTHLSDLVGQVFALLVLTVAAGEAAIGLAILVTYFRNRGSIAVEDVNQMRG